ncbi:MAG TPA: amidase family protein [Paracoccaceae bacterium]|nr:amidase family protein [Paracoccaceae bacterium]
MSAAADRVAAATAAARADRLGAVWDVAEDAAPGEGPLAGLTLGVKANLAVAGLPWTAGIEGWRGRIAEADAGAVARLRAGGAAVVATLAMEEGALGAVTDNPGFGRCLNPLGEGLTPGGSSGGSGAAVAAGIVDLALGTDTMGSVRIPAAYCGVAGLLPTAGLVGRGGLATLSPTLDRIGPLARDPALLWPAIRAMAGVDPEDPDAVPPPKGWAARPGRGLRGLRVGVPRQIAAVETEAAVRAGLERTVAALRDAGAEVREVDLAGWDPGRARRGGLLWTEAEGAVALAALRATPGALSEGFAAMLDYGARAPAAKLTEAAARIRAAGAAALRGLREADVLLLATAPQRAFRFGAAIPANQADLTALANFAGLPALALPVALPEEALPASVQLVGPAWSEARLTEWAEALAPRLS